MAVTFDPDKSALNVTLPGRAGLSFDKGADFDFETALVRGDTRLHPKTGKPDPERRYQGLGRSDAARCSWSTARPQRGSA